MNFTCFYNIVTTKFLMMKSMQLILAPTGKYFPQIRVSRMGRNSRDRFIHVAMYFAPPRDIEIPMCDVTQSCIYAGIGHQPPTHAPAHRTAT